jgi:surfeit locus 1 family protein
LGFWQLSRLEQRREWNAHIRERLALPATEWSALPHDSTSRMRRTALQGIPDYEHELVLATRSFEGSPGVNLLTPVRLAGQDTAVLVNRGWVYSADGVRVDRSQWREHSTFFNGYIEVLPSDARRGAETVISGQPFILRRLNVNAIRRLLPYPVAPLYLVAVAADSSLPVEQRVARLGLPVLDDGPHLSYAFQWFAFATIAVVGAGAVVVRNRAEARDHAPEAVREGRLQR